jgi:hypothetical protein
LSATSPVQRSVASQGSGDAPGGAAQRIEKEIRCALLRQTDEEECSVRAMLAAADEERLTTVEIRKDARDARCGAHRVDEPAQRLGAAWVER